MPLIRPSMLPWLLLVAIGCKRDDAPPAKARPSTSEEHRAPPAEVPAAKPADERPPCPKGPPQAAVKIGGASGVPKVVSGGIVWPDGSDVRLLPDESDEPRKVTEEELKKLLPQPERWLKRRCGAGGCGPHGGNIDLLLVDSSGEHVITKCQSEIEVAELVGSDVIWGTFGPYGASGGLYRSPATGGTATKLLDGAITELEIEGTDAYALAEDRVVWVDLASSQSQLIAKTASRPQSLVIRKERVFWAEQGDPYWASKPSGSIRSAPRHGGEVTIHASEQPWPEAIAVDHERIYWGSRNKGGVWSAPIAGGEISTVMPTDDKCGGTMWIHRSSRGIVIVRGDSMSFRFGDGGEIWLIPITPGGASAKPKAKSKPQ